MSNALSHMRVLHTNKDLTSLYESVHKEIYFFCFYTCFYLLAVVSQEESFLVYIEATALMGLLFLFNSVIDFLLGLVLFLFPFPKRVLWVFVDIIIFPLLVFDIYNAIKLFFSMCWNFFYVYSLFLFDVGGLLILTTVYFLVCVCVCVCVCVWYIWERENVSPWRSDLCAGLWYRSKQVKLLSCLLSDEYPWETY